MITPYVRGRRSRRVFTAPRTWDEVGSFAVQGAGHHCLVTGQQCRAGRLRTGFGSSPGGWSAVTGGRVTVRRAPGAAGRRVEGARRARAVRRRDAAVRRGGPSSAAPCGPTPAPIRPGVDAGRHAVRRHGRAERRRRHRPRHRRRRPRCAARRPCCPVAGRRAGLGSRATRRPCRRSVPPRAPVLWPNGDRRQVPSNGPSPWPAAAACPAPSETRRRTGLRPRPARGGDRHAAPWPWPGRRHGPTRPRPPRQAAPRRTAGRPRPVPSMPRRRPTGGATDCAANANHAPGFACRSGTPSMGHRSWRAARPAQRRTRNAHAPAAGRRLAGRSPRSAEALDPDAVHGLTCRHQQPRRVLRESVGAAHIGLPTTRWLLGQ